MIESMVKNNIDLIPESNFGNFYIRPLIFGSGQSLKVESSNEFTFVIYGSPIGNYFKNNARLVIENNYIRALDIKDKIGMGNIKYNGNYAQCFLPLKIAKDKQFSDVLYVNIDNTITETSSSNFFLVDQNNILRTDLGCILPGITRDTILKITDKLNIEFKIGPINFTDILNASEAFITGTGVCITPVEHISTPICTVDYNCNGELLSKSIIKIYKNIINEDIPDDNNWLHYIKY